MSEIDPLVAQILLKGDDEFLEKLKGVAEKGEENWKKLEAAFQQGLRGPKLAAEAFGFVEVALSAITAATVLFIEQQTELTQKTQLLADAFGTTGGKLQDIEAVFASSGVKVEQFERFANRLTITIAREWPAIADSIKNYANENDAAQLRVTNSILRVQDAQKALGDNAAERSSQMAKDNDAVEASYIKLQFAAQHAASEQLGALQSVRGAQLGVTAALQHLAELEGRPPSAAEKQNLQIAQAQQAVDTARRAEQDALVAQQEKAANAALKRRQMEQEYDDLARKAAKNARDDAEQREKDENSVKAAIIARGEEEAKAAKLALTNVASIRDALDSIAAGNKEVKGQVDLAQVSVQHLTQAIIAQAAETTKEKNGQPSAYETMISLSKTLHAATDDQISQQQRLALVNRLAATSMTALGGVGAELLSVMEHDSDELQRFNQEAEELSTEKAKKDIENFRGALAGLNLQISLLSQKFALAIAPTFTDFLRTVQESLRSSDGALHNFISGLITFKDFAVSVAAEAGKAFTFIKDQINEFSRRLGGNDLLKSTDMIKVAFIGIGAAITASLGPIGAIAVAIAAVVVAVGALRDHWAQVSQFIQDHRAAITGIGVAVAVVVAAFAPWSVVIGAIGAGIVLIIQHFDDVKDAIAKAWEKMKDNSVTRFWERLLDVIAKVKSLITGGGWQNPAAGNATAAAPDQSGSVPGHAEGGLIRGPGSGTSDSILSRLSNGEFVVKAAAVQAYGAGLFHALNNMMVPGFASGGLVAAPVRMGGGSGAIPATSVLNLSIDGRSFNGLKGPKSTIDDLSNFAIARQASSAGSNPSWMK